MWLLKINQVDEISARLPWFFSRVIVSSGRWEIPKKTWNNHFKRTSRWLLRILHKKWSFPLRISLANVNKSAGNYDLVTFTDDILNVKLHFSCSGNHKFSSGTAISFEFCEIFQRSLFAGHLRTTASALISSSMTEVPNI